MGEPALFFLLPGGSSPAFWLFRALDPKFRPQLEGRASTSILGAGSGVDFEGDVSRTPAHYRGG